LGTLGINLIYDFFALKIERVVQYHHATPLLVPCDVMAMGHVSRKMTHFHLCPRPRWRTLLRSQEP